jgi:hypothetical protein
MMDNALRMGVMGSRMHAYISTPAKGQGWTPAPKKEFFPNELDIKKRSEPIEWVIQIDGDLIVCKVV